MLIPLPKNRCGTDKILHLGKLVISCGEEEKQFVKTYLKMFCDLSFEFADFDAGNLIIKRIAEFGENEYRIKADLKTEIEYGTDEGLRNALASFIVLIGEENGEIYINKQEIHDFSKCKFRSVMIDLARGLPNIERLKEDIKRLSLAKCNFLHFHLMDEMGICYESAVFRGENIRGTKRYGIDTMKELVKYCHDLGISVIPEIEIPAHAKYLLKEYPELKCDCDDENQSLWTICAGNEKTYEFYSRLIDEICTIFPDEYIHVGGDELYFGDFPEWNSRCHWSECRVCGKRVEEEHLRGTGELYCYMMNRINEKIKSCGKKMIMWNDEVDISKDIPLSRDIIIEYWRISNENRGPRKGCSFNEFLKKGFTVINANFEKSYIDAEAYANPEKTASYSYKTYPTNDNGENIMGAETCAWEYGNPAAVHYNTSFSPSAILLLDKMWNTDDRAYNDVYRKALTKLILGTQTPQNYDMFEIFGSVMPPRTSENMTYATPKNELIDYETLEKHSSILKGIKNTYSPYYLKKLIEIVEKERG